MSDCEVFDTAGQILPFCFSGPRPTIRGIDEVRWVMPTVDETKPLPARALPPPSSVSEDLRTALRELVDPEAHRNLTVDSWLRFGGPEEDQVARIDALLAEKALCMDERRLSGVRCFIVTPPAAAKNDQRTLISLHAGGYSLGAGKGGTLEAILLAHACQCQVVAVDYRQPPEAPYPAALDDVLSVWAHLTASLDSSEIGICGSSSGGGLALSVVQRLISSRSALPGAVFAGTPWSDLTKTGDSYFINDIGLGCYEGPLEEMARAYAGTEDLASPAVSPVYGSFDGFPPTLLISGTRDLFLSNTVRVDQKLQEASSVSRLLVYEGHAHATYLNPRLPESKLAFSQIASFLDRHLGTSTSSHRKGGGE